MALQVWLPLNKSFRNCGLDIGVSATGTTVYSESGSPINGCYNFTASQNMTINGIDYSKLSHASVSVWVYQNSLKNTVFFTGPSTSHYIFAANNTGTSDIYHSGNVGGTKKLYVDGSSSTKKLGAAGAWHHYVVTDINLSAWTGTTLKFNNYSTGYNFTGRVCEIRIYDNVLTDEDVKRLYQKELYHFNAYWKHNTDMVFGDAIHIGRSINHNPHNVVQSGSSLYFNGSSSYIDFDGFNVSGGSVSVWLNIAAKPTRQQFVYYDPVAKMTIQFSSDGTLHLGGNGTSQPRYQVTGMTWGKMNHIVGVWNESRNPVTAYINGVKPSTGTTTSWSTAGTVAAIGKRLGLAATSENPLQGYINSIRVYTKQLTQAEVKELYDKGPEEKYKPVPSEYKMLEYIESTGASWFDTGIKFNAETDSFKVTFKGNDTSNNGMILASKSSKYFWLYYYSAGMNIYAYNTAQKSVIGPARDLNKHTVEFKNKVYYFDGVNKGTLAGTYTDTTNNLWMFAYGSDGGYAFKGRVYGVEISRNGVCRRKFYPVERISDSKRGMYDTINGVFYPSATATNFNAGPEI